MADFRCLILKGTKVFSVIAVFFGLFLVFGLASASTADLIQPASAITYNEELIVNATGRFDSIYIGKQGVGGVTFFNGTIVNATTTDGAGNPVTFGDDVRIDGEIWRIEKGGDHPLKISDHVIPTMDDINNFGTADHRWKDMYYSGTLQGAAASFSGDVTVKNLTASETTTTKNLSVNSTANINTLKVGGGYGKSGVTIDSSGNVKMDGKLTVKGAIDPTDITYSGTLSGNKASFSGDVTANSYSYGSSQTRYWSITGAEFIQNDETDEYEKSIGALYSTTNTFTAPVHLPHGAKVTKIKVYFWDNVDLDNNLTVRLYRNNMKMHEELMAKVTTEGANDSWRVGEDSSILYATIDNSQYAYRLYVNFGINSSDLRLGGVVIEYTVTNPLP